MRRFICCFGGKNVAQAPSGTTNEPRETSGSNVNATPSESSRQAPLRTINEQEESSGSNANALPLKSAQQALSETIKVQGESSGSNANVLPKNCGHSFSWSEIVSGTQNLQRTNLLGQGDFGDVFSCQFPNMVGAVKIQKSGSQLAHSEFVAEVKALNAADHPNVIKLLGKCDELRHRAIVYEFMPNRSLDRHILAPLRPGPSQLPVLDWNTRMRIAVGVAQGLVYVHRSLKMVHRDIKAGNVLLDNDLEPKLTDFGLAVDIVIGENGGENQKTIFPIKGTHGWVAPETLRNGYVSTKSDVYSYGVLLIHLFTGRKPCDEDRSILVRNLADWFSKRAHGREDYERKIVDAALGNMYSLEGLRKIFSTAMMCIHAKTHVRPTMNMVLPLVREASTHQPHQNSPVTERIF